MSWSLDRVSLCERIDRIRKRDLEEILRKGIKFLIDEKSQLFEIQLFQF